MDATEGQLSGLQWAFSSFVTLYFIACGYANAFQLPIDKAISKRKKFFLWFSPVMKQCLHNGVSLDVQV